MTPHYRILTVSESGLSQQFKDYLNKSVTKSDGESITNKSLIALDLLQLFNDSNLMFGGAIASWEPINENNSWSNLIIKGVEKLTCSNSNEVVSVEGHSLQSDRFHLSIAGFYPLLDIVNEFARGAEYKKVSFLKNNELIQSMHNKLCAQVILPVANLGNAKGVFLAVMAETNDLADLKIRELYELIFGG